ncbi:SDR family oxidoreductase [Spongorhabdus nitratireducens]
MKVLVIGGSGLIGRRLCSKLTQQGIPHIAPSHTELDLTDGQTIKSLLNREKPTVVVNTASYADVEKAETTPSLCFAVNRDGPALLAENCQQQGLPLVHISSYRVFDGEIKSPYTEKSTANPFGVLGGSRWQGEQQVRERCPEHIIIRFSWLFDCGRKNRLTDLIDQLRDEGKVQASHERIVCPTPAEDSARVITAILQQLDCGASPWGTYHYSAREPVSEHRFMDTLIAEVRQWTEIESEIICEADDRKRELMNSALDSEKVLNTFGIHARPWRPALAKAVRDTLQECEN